MSEARTTKLLMLRRSIPRNPAPGLIPMPAQFRVCRHNPPAGLPSRAPQSADVRWYHEAQSSGELNMVEISIAGDQLHLEVKGLDKLWAFKGQLDIPLRHILSVRHDPKAVSGWWHGIRFP